MPWTAVKTTDHSKSIIIMSHRIFGFWRSIMLEIYRDPAAWRRLHSPYDFNHVRYGTVPSVVYQNIFNYSASSVKSWKVRFAATTTALLCFCEARTIYWLSLGPLNKTPQILSSSRAHYPYRTPKELNNDDILVSQFAHRFSNPHH